MKQIIFSILMFMFGLVVSAQTPNYAVIDTSFLICQYTIKQNMDTLDNEGK